MVRDKQTTGSHLIVCNSVFFCELSCHTTLCANHQSTDSYRGKGADRESSMPQHSPGALVSGTYSYVLFSLLPAAFCNRMIFSCMSEMIDYRL